MLGLFGHISDELKVGDFVVVGGMINDKFVPACPNMRVRVEKITPGAMSTRVDLIWNDKDHSHVFLHDEGKYWVKATKFN